ncbi:hypothetical protein AB0B45_04050 [Nonomuraea sp. NPDC049152]|uniref:hypothetical protein n=1 Tax=Nonomuraea sp. NPDC049152 TaxID=3154350 RepID=UPI0033FDA5DA
MMTAAVSALLLIAAPDPVVALKQQFVPGHGVTFTERAKTMIDGDPFSSSKRRGVVQFDRSGVVSYDVKARSGLAKGAVRTIAVGEATYQRGGVIGKKWVRSPSKPGARTPFFSPILVLDPSAMKAMLATKGMITGSALYEASPSFRATVQSAKEAPSSIFWKLSTDPEGRPAKLVTWWTEPPGALGSVSKKSTLRFTSWGVPVNITAPPSS